MAVLDYPGLSHFKGKYDSQVEGILNDIVADEYSSSATYAVGDYVLYDGKLYICKTAIATAEEWTAAHWTEVDISGEVKDLKSSVDILETKVNEIAKYPNLVQQSDFTTDKYVAPNGSIYTATGLSYSIKIPVTVGQVIKANHRARFITAYNGDTAVEESGVSDETGADGVTSYTVPENINGLIFTFRNQYLADLIVYVYDGTDYPYIPYGKPTKINPNLLQTPLTVFANRKEKPTYARISGNSIAANAYIGLPIFCSTRKNTRLVFRAVISTLGNFEIGFTTGASASGTKYNRFLIGQNNFICYYAYNYTTQSMDSTGSIAHGLNITSGLLEIIIEELPDAKAKITIGNNGNTFTHTIEGYVKNNVLQPYCLAAYGVFGEYTFTWSCTDLYKNIWFFGDSYMAYSDARWAYYLEEYGYAKNALINSFPGCWSTAAITSFNNIITHGCPDFAVWAMGMNDGSDTQDAPSTSWVTGRDNFLTICNDNNITPIFCTIPTVQTVNNEQKNAWVRSSGYRYIDFAKAVNAQSNGTWGTGMLSSDGVHPSVNGARALFAEVLLDFPEIMIDQ